MLKPLFSLIFTAAMMISITFATKAQANETQATPTVQKEWTFLLFLNGHNNLDSYGAFNINQMEEVGSNDQVNMVVQWASIANKQTKRLYVTKDNDKNKVTSTAVESLAPVDMGDYKQLVEFVRWGVQKYPAKHYMIAIWNHGNGWHLMNTGAQVDPKDISYDDLTDNKITSEQLGLAMAESAKIIGHKVDIYGSDACLMAMAEVASEMRNSVEYFVGSQETEPGYGWPYNTWMKRWLADSTPTPAEVSSYLTEEYMKAYSGGIYGNQDVTFSAWDMSKLPAFESAMKAFNASLVNLNPADLTTTKSAAQDTQEFYSSDYKDIFDFADKLEAGRVGIDASVMTTLKQSIREMVISNGASSYYAGAHGVSVWMPTSSYYLNEFRDRYSKLEFNQATSWLDFLSALNK